VATGPVVKVIASVIGAGFALASTSVVTATPPPKAVPAIAANFFTADSGTARPVQSSATWSGYVVAHPALTDVSASWKVPDVTCETITAPQAAVFWVGLDGWYDNTVEQAGIEAYCSGKTPVYTAWWEMFPSNHISQVFPVRPGDTIAGSVHYLAGVFTITVRDVTTNRLSTVAARCRTGIVCARSSAEWIAESPTYDAQSAALPSWSALAFSSTIASAMISQEPERITGFVNFPVVMTGLHGRQAEPGSLLAGGSGFTEAWLASN
jgi:hypothetical protein